MSKRKKEVAKDDSNHWRGNVVDRFMKYVGNKELAKEIEQELYDYIYINSAVQERIEDKKKTKNNDNNILKMTYMYKLYSLLSNIDPESTVHNNYLLPKILSREITPYNLMRLNPVEIFPEHWEQIIKKTNETNNFLYKNNMKATSKTIKCIRCHQFQVKETEKQTRSADEPSTFFFECLLCNMKWRK
jgi:DNA-directed RNA polymerase subunit M/transcription elongation factor TFIIS